MKGALQLNVLIIVWGLLSFKAGWGQKQNLTPSPNGQIVTRLSKQYLLPGDHFTYEIEFKNISPSKILTSADFTDSPLILLEKPQTKKQGSNTIQRYLLSAELPGEFSLPLFVFTLSPKQDLGAHAGGLSLKVANLLEKKNPQPADIVDIQSEPLIKPLWLIIIGIVLGVLFLGLTIFLWKKRQKQKPVYVTPPDVWARQTLAELKKQINDDAHLQQLYFEISYCIRRFLGKSLNLFILESTTGEIKALLERIKYNPRKSEDIISLLQTLDNVKYALAANTLEQRQAVFEQAFAIVAENTVKTDSTDQSSLTAQGGKS